MSNVWDIFEEETENEIYQRELRNHEADESKDFELVGIIRYAVEEDKGSEVLCEGKAGDCVVLHTNKAVNYWHGMNGKEVLLRGTLIKKDATEKLIVSHAIPCSNSDGLKKISNEQLLKIEKIMKRFPLKERGLLYQQLANLETLSEASDERKVLSPSSSVQEMEEVFEIMKHLLPTDVVDEIEECLHVVRADDRSSSERQCCRKAIYYLLTHPWWGEDKVYNIQEVKTRLDSTHLALSHAKRELVKEVVGVNSSLEKTPRIIMLVGPSGSGMTTLAQSLFEGMGKKYAEINLAGIEDEILVSGSGKEYDNGRPGSILHRLHSIGNDGGLILSNVDQASSVCWNVLESLLENKFVDHFLMVPVDTKNVWVVLTANDIEKVDKKFREKVHKIIQMDSYTLEEKNAIINKVFIPKYCHEYGMKQSGEFSEDVCKEIHRFVAGKSIKKIGQIVQDIFLSALEKGEDFPQITSENFSSYYSLGDIEKIKESYASTYVEMETKASVCYFMYPESIQKRNRELLDMMTGDSENDKTYAKKALEVTTNILRTEEKDIDIQKVREVLDRTHYGMEEVKNAICRNVAARTVVKDTKVKVLLLNGAAGVGKTSIGRTIAETLGRPFVKISLNGIYDLGDLKGTPRNVKDGGPGLIPKHLVKEGIGSYHAVVLLDEMDKLGEKQCTALYDILDSDNGGYYDNYLECFVETKNLIFIITSNDKERIPATILDRCEVIEVGGYSKKQKKSIARDYVIPRMESRYQIQQIQIEDDAMDLLLKEYCVSLGVRDVERAMEKIIENDILARADGKSPKLMNINVKNVRDALNGEKNRNNESVDAGKGQSGNARALAVAGNYGVWFDIQVTSNEYGSENVKVTGLAKGSFAESIDVAKTLVCNRMKKSMPKIHLHATCEGVEKDGPSAGLTIFSCLMSFMKNMPLPNVAFTGAIDLFGKVKKIGGAELKLKAAERAGVDVVYMPKENFEELRDSKELEHHDVRVVPITHVDEIVRELFGEGA